MEFLEIRNPENLFEMDLFQTVAERVYQNDLVWVPHSEMMWKQRFRQLHQELGTFVMPIVALERGQPVSRCLLQLNPRALDSYGAPQAWIGFFECLEDFQDSAKKMLAYGEKILQQHGARTAVISKSDNQMAGVLTSGFELPPVVFTNHNPKYYFDLLKSCDYIPETKFITLYFTREKTKRFHISLPGLRTREFNRINLNQEIDTFHNLQTKIFEGRPGYVPRTIAEDYQMIQFFLPFLDDQFIIIAETTSGCPIGLLVCIPDMYQHLRGEQINRARLMSIGAIPAYANKGVGVLMGSHLMRNLLNATQYVSVEASWIMSHNRPPQNLAKRFNAVPGKEYWLLEKSLV